MLELHADSHLDHGLTQDHINFILNKFADRHAFFIETFELPDELPSVPCGLHGPIMGDAPVPSIACVDWKRGKREYTSRLCGKAPRLVRTVTVIAGPYKDERACVLYTAFGGPLAPREPGDPELTDNQREESIAFWAEHALSLPTGANGRMMIEVKPGGEVGEHECLLVAGPAGSDYGPLAGFTVVRVEGV